MPSRCSFRIAARTAPLPFILALGACSTAPRVATTPPRSLSAGERAEVPVAARAVENHSGVLMEQGATYSVRVADDDKWTDFYIRSDANGYECPLLARFAAKKPLPEAPWFSLLGRIGDGAVFVIGSDWTGTVETGGELTLFANDRPGFYWNNFGSVKATVTRLP